MKWAIAFVLISLLLFGPLIVFLAERTRHKWLRPLSYLCILLGPALAILGIIQHIRIQKMREEAAESGGFYKTWYSQGETEPGQKSTVKKSTP